MNSRRIKYYLQGFVYLSKGYWQSEEKWKAYGILSMVLILIFASVGLTVLINNWYKDFWDVLQDYEFDSFWYLVGKFSIIATGYIIIGVYSVYLKQLLQIKWRTWMTKQYLSTWMEKRAYYKLKLLGKDMDNPDQRISEDIDQFVSLTISLTIGLLHQVITLVAFTVILWNLSAVLTIPLGDHEFKIYGYMVWLSLIYSIVGTYLTHKIGRILIRLNYEQQKYEADFRFSMMRVRENTESIAFYRGEKPELQNFLQRFSAVIVNFRDIMNREKLINAFTAGYGQLAIIIPLLLAAPRWFAKEVQVGWIMQVSNSFGQVQGAMSYFVEAYTTIAQWCAVVRRLVGFTEHVDDAKQLESKLQLAESDLVGLEQVDIGLPTGQLLLRDCNLNLTNAHSLLIMGASGTGKSTLLRTLAGLWPYATGKIFLPKAECCLFLPQRPYLPLGSLKQALAYPLVEESLSQEYSDEQLNDVLKVCRLPQLVDKLNVIDDWSRILSLGEQQRLAFARILLYKPQYVFLDEATSALDESLEATLYDILKQCLPETKIISVGHRSSLKAKHESIALLSEQHLIVT